MTCVKFPKHVTTVREQGMGRGRFVRADPRTSPRALAVGPELGTEYPAFYRRDEDGTDGSRAFGGETVILALCARAKGACGGRMAEAQTGKQLA